MRLVKDRLVAHSSVGLGLLVLTALFLALRPLFVERWLIHRLSSGEIEERKTAARRLGEMGSRRAVIPLLELWKREGGGAGEYALEALKGMGPRAVPELASALRSEDDVIREGALKAIASIGEEAREAIPGLVEVLDDGTGKITRLVMAALGTMGPAAVPGYARALRNPLLRGESARALWEHSEKAEEAVPELLAALEDLDGGVRSLVFAALARISARSGSLVPVLAQAFRCSHHDVRNWSAAALAQVPEGRQALLETQKALSLKGGKR